MRIAVNKSVILPLLLATTIGISSCIAQPNLSSVSPSGTQKKPAQLNLPQVKPRLAPSKDITNPNESESTPDTQAFILVDLTGESLLANQGSESELKQLDRVVVTITDEKMPELILGQEVTYTSYDELTQIGLQLSTPYDPGLLSLPPEKINIDIQFLRPDVSEDKAFTAQQGMTSVLPDTSLVIASLGVVISNTSRVTSSPTPTLPDDRFAVKTKIIVTYDPRTGKSALDIAREKAKSITRQIENKNSQGVAINISKSGSGPLKASVSGGTVTSSNNFTATTTNPNPLSFKPNQLPFQTPQRLRAVARDPGLVIQWEALPESAARLDEAIYGTEITYSISIDNLNLFRFKHALTNRSRPTVNIPLSSIPLPLNKKSYQINVRSFSSGRPQYDSQFILNGPLAPKTTPTPSPTPTPPPVPELLEPEELKIEGHAPDSLYLTWKRPKNELPLRFSIFIKKESETEFKEVASQRENFTHLYNNLESGTQYTLGVKAIYHTLSNLESKIASITYRTTSTERSGQGNFSGGGDTGKDAVPVQTTTTPTPTLTPTPFNTIGEFAINTFTTGNQQTPTMAMDPNGDVVVAWESYAQESGNPSNYGIFAQRYNFLKGAKAGTEFQVNTTIANTQRHPDVAVASDGSFIIVWDSTNQAPDSNAEGVFFQRFDKNGNKIGGEVLVNTTTLFSQFRPAIAIAPNGNFAIAWENFSGNSDIYTRLYSSDGTPLTAETIVTNAALEQEKPDIAMKSDGSYVITWQDSGAGNYDIKAREFSAAGVAGSMLNIATGAGDQKEPAIATASSGSNYVIAYQDDPGGNPDIKASLNGTTPITVSNQANQQVTPSVAMDSNGNFVVTYSSYGQAPDSNNFGIFAQRYNASGVPQGSELAVNQIKTIGIQNNPSIAMPPDGKFIINWQGAGQDKPAETNNYGIFGLRYDASGHRK